LASCRGKPIAILPMPHSDGEHPWRVNGIWSSIGDNEGIVWVFDHITEILTALIPKNTLYHRKNMTSKSIVIANCIIYSNISLVVEYAMLIRYNYTTSNQEPYMNQLMDPLGIRLTTGPIQTGWEISIELYMS
jgi:hypothetical protein